MNNKLNATPTPKKKRNFARQVRAFLQKHSDDLLLAAGWVMIVYGVSMISFAAAWITGGVMCGIIAVLIGIGGRQ